MATGSHGDAEGLACVHHWVIADGRGETSMGRCAKCGAEAEFINSFYAYTHRPISRGRQQVVNQLDGDISAAMLQAGLGPGYGGRE